MILQIFVLSVIFTCSIVETKSLCKVLQRHKNTRVLPKPPNCGPVHPESKIMGGDDAEVGEFPWMVTIYKEKVPADGLKTKFCDGVILTKRFIVTAAHCLVAFVRTNDNMYVRLGEYDVMDYSTIKPIEIPVKAYLVHPEYNNKTHANDIAIIRTVRNMIFVKGTVYPICLPFTCDIIKLNLYRSQLMLAGWGYLQERPVPVEAEILQKIPMRVVPNSQCQRSWGNLVSVESKQICARGQSQGASACQGDSGGPLMLRYNRFTYLVGVVSIGDTCIPYSPSQNPNVFARVASYTKWILDNIH